MEGIIDKRFEGVERALATLVTSLSTYNPNPSLANDLVDADAELSQGLELLSTHQANYARILELRATTDTLDTQIRETLCLLATTRKDLLETPSTTEPEIANPITYSELLSYAGRISKFTQPPAAPEINLKGVVESDANTPKELNSQAQTNGTTTLAATNGASVSVEEGSAFRMDTATPALAIQPVDTRTTVEVTRDQWNTYLNAPLVPGTFFPWPSEQAIRSGALASIQILMDQGVDPTTFDPAQSAALEAETKRLAEEEELKREQEVAEKIKEATERKGTQQAQSNKPRQFELETFDDDDDD